MTPRNLLLKRVFDVVVATAGLALIGWLVGIVAICARWDTGQSGIFRQQRIGRFGRLFWLYKIRTMRDVPGVRSTITTSRDPRITRLGRLLRRWKIDELPQLVNVLRGDMSLVGPRPEVPDYLERIRSEAALVLSVRPGITGPASIKYRHEEQILATQANPIAFNEQVIYPDKLRINLAYVRNCSFRIDLVYLWQSVWPFRSVGAYASSVGFAEAKPQAIGISLGMPGSLWESSGSEARVVSKWPVCADDERAAADRVLRSGKLNYWTGDEGRHFEREFAGATAAAYAVAVANGTVAIELALWALGIGPGHEVIVPSRTFVASASAIVRCGATPVFADVDRDSQNITAESIAERLSSRTKAVIVVHLAGWPCEMEPILELARRHGLYVIEDCAQALGASYRGRPVGSLGDVGTFSFCQDKILTTAGEGGMLVTNHRDLWQRAWSLKDHGKSYEAVYHREHPAGFRWLHEHIGTNWRMTEMQSAIGRVALRKLESWVETRRRNAAILAQRFSAIAGLRTPQPIGHAKHAYYKFYTFVEPNKRDDGWTRDRILEEINNRGVPCFSGSCSEIYLEKAFSPAMQPRQRLRVARELGETSLMFPVDPTLGPADMDLIAAGVNQVIARACGGPSRSRFRAA